MTPADRESALKILDDSRERLLGTLKALSREQMEYRQAPDRWSVAEILEHIILTERFVLGALDNPKPFTPDPSKRSRWEGRDEAFVARIAAERENGFTAPEPLRPTGRWPTEMLIAEFEAARVPTREFAASTQLDLRSRIVRHPAPPIGEIDAFQLLLMIGAHSDRHRAQCEEVLASRVG